jgi:hypothetical protein
MEISAYRNLALAWAVIGMDRADLVIFGLNSGPFLARPSA